MSRMTKSSLAFAKAALDAANECLTPYSHPNSPQKFTQPQLFAILALKDFLKQDYRGIIQMLAEWSDLRDVLGLKRLPHYSTLCYAHRRLLKKKTSQTS